MDRIDTPEKVLSYLQEQEIGHDDDASTAHLFMLAKRRLRRRLFETGSLVRSSQVNPVLAISMVDLYDAIGRMKDRAELSGNKEQIWPTVRFTIEEFPDPDLVCLKHQVTDNSKCKGKVVDGECNGCYLRVPGVIAYSFKVIAEGAQGKQLTMQVSDKGGQQLFQKSAAQFNMLGRRAQGEAMELISGVDFAAKLIVTYDPDAEDFFACIFDAVRA